MKHVFISRKGDKEFIQKKYFEFSKYQDLKLIEMYNREVNIGLVGVHAQAKHLIALHIAFQKRFGKSPISITDNSLIALNSKIESKVHSWQFIVE